MSDIRVIERYFPDLLPLQVEQLQALGSLYLEWNEKVNLISRKDIDHIYDRHLLHALAIRKVVAFSKGSNLLDLGTGGGLPGLPLGIVFPNCQFHLIDARQKKIKVVNDIIDKLGLDNISTAHGRVEEVKNRKFDFIISRAVARTEKLISWSSHLLDDNEKNTIPNGYLLLKGGDLRGELNEARVAHVAELYELNKYFNDEWYAEKYVVYIPG